MRSTLLLPSSRLVWRRVGGASLWLCLLLSVVAVGLHGAQAQSATPTPVPDLPFTQILPAQAEPIFTDTFDGPGNGGLPVLTDARRTTAYADGQYIVTVALQDQSVSPGWAQFYTDMAFEVEATWQAVGSQSGVGLRFRVRDDHAYLFLIEADGWFTLRRQLETETTLAEGISPFINQGVASNRLGVVADGNRISVYANGHLLSAVTDDALTTGQIMLEVRSGDPDPVRLAFDNATVWGWPQAAPPTPTPVFLPKLPVGASLAFSDTFDLRQDVTLDQGTTTSSQRFYGEGNYHIMVTASQDYWQSAWGKTLYRDFAVAVWVEFADNSTDGSAGLALRAQSAAGDGYQFLLSPQGRYLLRKNRGGLPSILAEGQAASFLKTNAARNELSALVNNDRFTLFVNGRQVAAVSDDSYREGYVGLVAVAQQTPVHAVFRDASIYTWPETASFNDALPANARLQATETFDDPASGFMRNEHLGDRERYYADGQYHVVVHEPTSGWMAVDSESFGDFAAEVEISPQLAGADHVAGLVFRYQNETNHYQFVIRQDGFYGLSRFQTDQDATLVSWRSSEFIERGAVTNTLGLIANGTQLSLYANGHLLGLAEDAAFSGGKLGLVAFAGAAPTDHHVVFDNLRIWTWSADIATESSSPWTTIGGILLVLFITVLTNYNRILDLLLPSSVTAIKLGPLTIPLNRTGAPYMPRAGDFASRAGSVYTLVEPPQPDADKGTQTAADTHPGAHPTGRTPLPLKPIWPLLDRSSAVTPTPLHRNPYIVGPPIEDRALFFGREDVFDYVRSGLATRADNVTLVLYGGRRTGKTSVLRQIQRGRLGTTFAPVYVDMQVMAEVDTHEFFGKIGRAISLALPEAPLQASLDALADRGQNAYSLFETLLVQATEAAGQRTLLLMFDEYEILERLVDGGRLSADIFPYLKSLMEQPRRLAFLFTGSRPLEEMRGQYWDWARTFSPARYKRISFLTDDAARRLVVEPVESFLTYDEAALAAVLRLGAGHPYFTQGLCSTIVDAALQESRPTVSLAALQEAVTDLVENPLPHMIYLWNEANRAERLVLAGLAAFLTDGDAWLSAAALTAQLEPHHSGLTPDQERTALAALVRQELLERQDDRFRYRIDFLRHWIAEDHSLWQTLAEH